MNNWIKIRQRIIIYEILAVCVVFGLLAVGLWLQLHLDSIFGTVMENIDKDFALVILQIQTTIDTLTIAIIALISGSISDSNMGIVFSDYYLNIRPFIFKQKRIIVSSLILLAINIGFYIGGWYCFGLCLFAVTTVLILMSINEIYLIFAGKSLAVRETKHYINFILARKCDYRKKYNICVEFVNDWKNAIPSQSKEVFESYKEVFLSGLAALLCYQTQESLTGIKGLCKETEYCFLNSENSVVRENGIELLEEIYASLWKYILENKEKINYQEPFDLFGEIGIYVVDAIKEMSPEKVQKCIRWDSFIESVQRITFWIGYDEDSSKSELGNTYHFARFAGYYLSTHYNEKYTLYWKRILRSSFWSCKANIPEERIEDFLEARCIVKFNYIYGLVENGLDNIVIESFFCDAMANIFRLKEKYEVLLGLLVHCYLYYLSERESENVIAPEMRTCAKNIILHRDVKRVYKSFLENLCINSSSLDIDILKQMIKILSPYEQFNDHLKRSMIIKNVINEYYMFIILYLSNTYHMPGLLERNLDDDIYSGYLYENKAENTKQMLIELYTLIDDRESSNQEIAAKAELMYDEFSAFEKQKFKEKQMKKAVQNQIQYIWNVDVAKVKNHIKRMVEEKLREKFKEIIVDTGKQDEVIDIPVLNLFDYTDSVNENCVDSFCPNIYGQFSIGLEWILRKRNVLDQVDRMKDFSDDRDYMNYLQSNNLELLIGSKYVLVNRDYSLAHDFEKLTENWKVIYTMLMENGLALKKDSVKVCIHSIEVVIRPQKISDEKQNYNTETELYTYSIYSGMPIDFQEHELEAFLHDNRKVIEISAKISVQTAAGRVGTLVMAKRG